MHRNVSAVLLYNSKNKILAAKRYNYELIINFSKSSVRINSNSFLFDNVLPVFTGMFLGREFNKGLNADDTNFALLRLIFAGLFRYYSSSVAMFSFEKDSKENLGNELINEPDMYCDQRNTVHQIKQNEIK